MLSEDALKRTNKIFQIPEKENVKANAGNKNLKGRNLQGTTNKITKYINSPGGQAKIIGGNINDGDIQEVKINDTTAESFAYLLVDLPQGINEIEIFFTSNDINSNSLFRSMQNLISVDLSEFTASSNDISYVFAGCSGLQKVIMKNFITSNINSVYSLFEGCTNLEYVNFDNCDFCNVKYVFYMFFNCGELKSIDLSSFNTNIFESGDSFSEWFSGTNGNNDELLYLDLQNFEFKLSDQTNTATLNLVNKPNLKYLNIKNYKTYSNIYLNFKVCSVITICMLSETFSQLRTYYTDKIFSGSWTLINDCSHPSFQGQYKF